MTESEFTRKVNSILAKTHGVYCEKMFNPMRGGTPDCWYSLKGHPDIWVEFKYLKSLPVRERDVGCSELQKRWLIARREEGRNVFVLVATPDGAVLYPVSFLETTGWKCYSQHFECGKNVSQIAVLKILRTFDYLKGVAYANE